MYDFIDILKALAAILITNSHYDFIWPVSALAMGGLLGDIMFFAASGFCLANIRMSFPRWYLRRIIRIYPTLWIVTGAALLIGYLRVSSLGEVLSYFVYPTSYHFIASIMLIYVLFYPLMWIYRKLNLKLIWIMGGVFAVYVIVYLTIFDASYYHIDVVEEYMVRFLYLESMLLGVWFREKMDQQKIRVPECCFGVVVSFFVSAALYFASKLLFTAVDSLAPFQILNQITIFLLLYNAILLLCMWEVKGKRGYNKLTGGATRCLSRMTLEIYLTQYLVFYLVPDLEFPVNFVVVTASILICAWLANRVGAFLTNHLNAWAEKALFNNNENQSQ